jgi:lipopolysaccharide/colanic/teichoic acid biosynthesis glycosyltransferase
MKRAFDLVLTVAGLLVIGPLLLLLALCVKLGSRGPVFYLGARVGRGGRPFNIIKFRTMIVDADKGGPTTTTGDDPRVTPIGHFLRRFKIDELPQLLNVLAGQMSLVGPRPQVRWAVDLYSADELNLLTVRPGITDYASLVFRNEGDLLLGSTDPDRDYLEKIAPEKIRLGLYYVETHSVQNDLKIILATVGAIFGKDPGWCLPPHRIPTIEPNQKPDSEGRVNHERISH